MLREEGWGAHKTREENKTVEEHGVHGPCLGTDLCYTPGEFLERARCLGQPGRDGHSRSSPGSEYNQGETSPSPRSQRGMFQSFQDKKPRK